MTQFPPGRSRLRHAAKTAVFAVLCVALVLIPAEVVLRVFDPIGIDYFREVSRYRASRQPDDLFAYIHAPGCRAPFQGVEVSINSHGLRGPEFASAKPPGKTRILVLGDSVVLGWGVPQGDLFPLKLQALLGAQFPDVEVIPAGVGSWNTRTEYEYLRSRAIGFGPDILILVITGNDLEPHAEGRTEVSKKLLLGGARPRGAPVRVAERAWRLVVRRSYLASYAQFLFRTRAARDARRRASDTSPRWEDARLALDGIIRLCRDQGIELIPCVYGSDATVRQTETLGLYAKHLETKGLRVLTLPDVLFSDRNHRNSVVDGHPNAKGHEVIALQLYQHLVPMLTSRSRGAP